MDEDKKLDVNDLNEVAGGNGGSVSTDSIFLNRLGLLDESYTNMVKLWFNFPEYGDKVSAAWAKVCVTCRVNGDGPDEFSVDGVRITRREAYQIAVDKTGIPFKIDTFFNMDQSDRKNIL